MSQNKIKIIFAGTPSFAVPFLESLLNDSDFEVLAVITQPDKPAGRKQTLTPPPIKELALKYNLKIFQPENLKNDSVTKELKELKPDLLVLVAYGLLIPKDILSLAKKGNINVHPSLLPQYRGASPVQSVILAGDDKTGVTIMLMDEELDHGPILAQKEIGLNGDETNETLHNKLVKVGVPLLNQTVKDYLSGKIQPQEQDHDKATSCKIIAKDQARLDWSEPAEKIERKIRAFYPWPAAWTVLDGKRLKIFPPAVVIKTLKQQNAKTSQAGEIIINNNDFIVVCGTDFLEIKNLQLEGKKEMTAADFLRGQQNLKGKILK